MNLKLIYFQLSCLLFVNIVFASPVPQFDYDSLLYGARAMRKPSGITNIETNVYTNTNYVDQSRHYTHNITLTDPGLRQPTRPKGGNKNNRPTSRPESSKKKPQNQYPGEQGINPQNRGQGYPGVQVYPTDQQYPGVQQYPVGDQYPVREQYPASQQYPSGQQYPLGPVSPPNSDQAGGISLYSAKEQKTPTVQKWEKHDTQIYPREYHDRSEYHERRQYREYDY